MHARALCLCLAVTLVFADTTVGAQTTGGAPRPLDPLTSTERAVADSVARADARLRPLLAARGAELVQVTFVAGKPRDEKSRDPDAIPIRQAAVQYFLRSANTGVTALVDLATRSVADVARQPGRDVPLGLAEVDRAARLVLADPRVQRLFNGTMPPFRSERSADGPDTSATRVDAIRIVAPKGDPCFERRCVAIFFRVNDRYVNLGRVVVDLLRDSVIMRGGVR